MNIDILCIGSLKEAYWKDAVKEYEKRLQKYCKLDIIEIKEAILPKNASKADEDAVKIAEGKATIGKIKNQSFVIALDVKGKRFGSESFAKELSELAIRGKSRIAFIIGGSLGLSKEVLDAADLRMSFSEMTFPHQLMRVILLEQIYRAFKINNGETYHK